MANHHFHFSDDRNNPFRGDNNNNNVVEDYDPFSQVPSNAYYGGRRDDDDQGDGSASEEDHSIDDVIAGGDRDDCVSSVTSASTNASTIESSRNYQEHVDVNVNVQMMDGMSPQMKKGKGRRSPGGVGGEVDDEDGDDEEDDDDDDPDRIDEEDFRRTVRDLIGVLVTANGGGEPSAVVSDCDSETDDDEDDSDEDEGEGDDDEAELDRRMRTLLGTLSQSNGGVGGVGEMDGTDDDEPEGADAGTTLLGEVLGIGSDDGEGTAGEDGRSTIGKAKTAESEESLKSADLFNSHSNSLSSWLGEKTNTGASNSTDDTERHRNDGGGGAAATGEGGRGPGILPSRSEFFRDLDAFDADLEATNAKKKGGKQVKTRGKYDSGSDDGEGDSVQSGTSGRSGTSGKAKGKGGIKAWASRGGGGGKNRLGKSSARDGGGDDSVASSKESRRSARSGRTVKASNAQQRKGSSASVTPSSTAMISSTSRAIIPVGDGKGNASYSNALAPSPADDGAGSRIAALAEPSGRAGGGGLLSSQADRLAALSRSTGGGTTGPTLPPLPAARKSNPPPPPAPEGEDDPGRKGQPERVHHNDGLSTSSEEDPRDSDIDTSDEDISVYSGKSGSSKSRLWKKGRGKSKSRGGGLSGSSPILAAGRKKLEKAVSKRKGGIKKPPLPRDKAAYAREKEFQPSLLSKIDSSSGSAEDHGQEHGGGADHGRFLDSGGGGGGEGGQRRTDKRGSYSFGSIAVVDDAAAPAVGATEEAPPPPPPPPAVDDHGFLLPDAGGGANNKTTTSSSSDWFGGSPSAFDKAATATAPSTSMGAGGGPFAFSPPAVDESGTDIFASIGRDIDFFFGHDFDEGGGAFGGDGEHGGAYEGLDDDDLNRSTRSMKDALEAMSSSFRSFNRQQPEASLTPPFSPRGTTPKGGGGRKSRDVGSKGGGRKDLKALRKDEPKLLVSQDSPEDYTFDGEKRSWGTLVVEEEVVAEKTDDRTGPSARGHAPPSSRAADPSTAPGAVLDEDGFPTTTSNANAFASADGWWNSGEGRTDLGGATGRSRAHDPWGGGGGGGDDDDDSLFPGGERDENSSRSGGAPDDHHHVGPVSVDISPGRSVEGAEALVAKRARMMAMTTRTDLDSHAGAGQGDRGGHVPASMSAGSSRIDAVEAAARRRIEMLRKMIAEKAKAEGGSSTGEAAAESSEAMMSQLEFIEAETLKQISKVRGRMDNQERHPQRALLGKIGGAAPMNHR